MINQYPAWKYPLMAVALLAGAVSALPDPTLQPHPLPDVQ